MKKIFFTLLFCLVLSLALTGISLAKECENDNDCLSEAICRLSNGLTYRSCCCLEEGTTCPPETSCGKEGWEWLYDNCLLDPREENAWCEKGC